MLGLLLGLIVYGTILTAVLMYFLDLDRRAALAVTGMFLGLKLLIAMGLAFLGD